MQLPSSDIPIPVLRNLLKIEGPPGSGKTRALAREACRLIAGEGVSADRVLVLAMTSPGKRRLMDYFRQEARLAALSTAEVSILTWEEWLLILLKASDDPVDQAVQLLFDADARVLLQESVRQAIPAGHTLYYASRQASFGRIFFELIRQLQLQGISPDDLAELTLEKADPDSRLPLVAEVFRLFVKQTAAVGLLCQAELVSRALSVIGRHLSELTGRYSVILADDAQELSEAHHQCLARLADQVVLAGNERLSIRSFRGACPEAFVTLSAYGQSPVTFLPQLACMRNNEAILSVLNTLLPTPIWEEQAVNTEQLKAMVQFGCYRDPQQEADGVARFLAHFVQTAQVDDRPASWDDCVILLRSSHYQPHMVHALSQRGIPFRMDVLSEALIGFQHRLYDLLCVLDGWKKLGILPAMLRDPLVLKRHWETLSMPIVAQWELAQLNNRHVLRWLEAMLMETEAGRNASDWQGMPSVSPDENSFLLVQLVDQSLLSPRLAGVVQVLFGLYALYWHSGCPVELLQAVMHGDTLPTPDKLVADSDLDAGKVSVLAGVEMFRENLERLNSHYQATFGQPLPLSELLRTFHSLWQGGLDKTVLALSVQGAVRLLSIHQVQGEEFPCVAIPFLVSGEFPYAREIPQVLSSADEALLGIPMAYRINAAEEARLLAVGLSRATRQVLLGCHEMDAETPVLPSAFYSALRNGKRALLGQPSESTLCAGVGPCDLDDCAYHPAQALLPGDSRVEEANAGRYMGESVWARLSREPVAPLFEVDETVYLSASSIKTYMKCPRQFYYRHLLRLPQPGNEAAILGTLVHRVMEVFNLQAATQPYTAARLKHLAAALFLFEDELDVFFEAGFSDKDRQELRRLSPLTLSSQRQRLMDSIDDLERKGYFERYGNLKRIHPEKALEGFQLEGLERCRFTGTMDAVVQLADGSWDIIDYKTFRNAYSVGLDTCDKRFLETLDPLPDDEGLSHAERFADKLSGAYPKDYQLPLYYLACRQDPVYRDGVNAVTLQVMRPAFPDNPSQGAIRLQIPGADIEAKKEQMIQDIRRYIVEPMLGSTVFATSPGRGSCGNCGYFGICEADNEDAAGGEE